MKIIIIDTVNQDIGLKILFPEANYYIHNTEDCTVNNRQNSYKIYNFTPIMDFSNINDLNYDYLFIILSTYNITSISSFFQENIKNIFDKITNIINSNNFRFVGLFDNYDFDYDPNTIINNKKINLFFKRNYNKNKTYEKKCRTIPIYNVW